MESGFLTFCVMKAIYFLVYLFLRQKEIHILEAEDFNLNKFDLESYL